MKELLFTMTSTERKNVSSKYAEKQPKPLNTKFTERKNKPEAVKSYISNKNKETTLYPSGNYLLCSYLSLS